jgi:hypothetical protein
MSQSFPCPDCGSINAIAARFCWSCKRQLKQPPAYEKFVLRGLLALAVAAAVYTAGWIIFCAIGGAHAVKDISNAHGP